MAKANDERARIEDLLAPFRIDTPKSFDLGEHDPAGTDGVKSKKAAAARLTDGIERLTDLQTRWPRSRPTASSSSSKPSMRLGRTVRSGTS